MQVAAAAGRGCAQGSGLIKVAHSARLVNLVHPVAVATPLRVSKLGRLHLSPRHQRGIAAGLGKEVEGEPSEQEEVGRPAQEAAGVDDGDDLHKHRQEAKKVLKNIIESGPQADKIISQMGEVGAIDDILLQVTWDRLATAREDAEKAVADCLEAVFSRLQAEVQMRSSSAAMRLFNDLLGLAEQGGEAEDTMNAMIEAFAGPTSGVMAVDVFEMSRDIAEKGAEALPRERVRRSDFIAEVGALLEAGEAALASAAAEEGHQPGLQDARAEAEVTLQRMRDMVTIARGLPDYDDDEGVSLPF